MTGDRYRPLTAAAVLLVVAIAAVVSYVHVATLALRYGQPPLAAYLLPLSIDGLVATSSLVLLRSARAGVSAPWLACTGLVLAGGGHLSPERGQWPASSHPAASVYAWDACLAIKSVTQLARLGPDRPVPGASGSATRRVADPDGTAGGAC